MSNKNTHTWVDNECTVCGIERCIEGFKTPNGYAHKTIYYKGKFKLRYLPKCSGIFKFNNNRKPLKRTAIKKKIKKTGERDLHLEIWEERPHICFVSKEPLGDEPLPIYFSHVLSKGAYPGYRLYKPNIVLMSAKMHIKYEFGSIENDPLFDGVKKLKQKLIKQYYADR